MKRITIWILALSLLCLCACGKRDEAPVKDRDTVRDAGVLRIGVTRCPGFSEYTGDEWEGFDIALAESLCRELDLKPEFVEVDWDTRWDALENRTVDCLMGALSATDALLDRADLTQTYLASRPVLVTLPSVTLSGLNGIEIAVESGSAGELAVSACLEGARALSVSSQLEALTLVEKGEAQAAVVDALVARAALDDMGLVILQDHDLGIEELTIALRKGSDLTEDCNAALRELQSGGKLEELARDHGLTEALIQG